MNKRRFVQWCIPVLAGLLLMIVLPSVAAAPLPLPPRPPASTPTPAVAPTSIPAPKSAPVGALIQLRIQITSASLLPSWQELWTIVQWQDGLGGWHDVEGWRGTPDGLEGSEAIKTWWLAEDLLGRGPFRWQVYRSEGGRLLGTSAPFNMPTSKGQTLKIAVSVR